LADLPPRLLKCHSKLNFSPDGGHLLASSQQDAIITCPAAAPYLWQTGISAFEH